MDVFSLEEEDYGCLFLTQESKEQHVEEAVSEENLFWGLTEKILRRHVLRW